MLLRKPRVCRSSSPLLNRSVDQVGISSRPRRSGRCGNVWFGPDLCYHCNIQQRKAQSARVAERQKKKGKSPRRADPCAITSSLHTSALSATDYSPAAESSREQSAGVTGSNIYIYLVARGIDRHVTHLQFYSTRRCSSVSGGSARSVELCSGCWRTVITV